MTIGFLFWLLMVLWGLFGFGVIAIPAAPWGGTLLLFVLLFLLGWKVFGFIIKDSANP